MNIAKRAAAIKGMMNKTLPKPEAPKQKDLFPKLNGTNKPPSLTSSSQPKMDINDSGLATLPKMKVNGSKPKFSSKMQNKNPYQKN